MSDAASALSAWADFYVIVGSSGGALIGLQFVVITLIAESRHRTDAGALSAFGTPTVVHFVGAVLVSAIASAPWPSFRALSVAVGVCGAGGLVYATLVIHRARRQKDYVPVWEDWVWYAALPCAGYAALVAAAALVHANPRGALFVVAGATLGLLLIGIHNAWDTVTHIIISNPRENSTRTD